MAGFRQQDPCLLGQYHRQNEGIDNDRKSRGHSTREHQCPLLHRKGLVRNRQGVIDDSFLSWILVLSMRRCTTSFTGKTGTNINKNA